VTSPRRFEGDDPRCVRLLPVEKVPDDGFAISLLSGRLRISQPRSIVVQDQIDGDIVRGLKHAAGHGTHSHEDPFRGIVTTPLAGGRRLFDGAMLVVRADGFVDPCIPSRASKPPSGPDWIHEVKHDGYRLIVRRDGEIVRLFTRRGHDWTERYPAIASAAAKLKV
jgi:ATP dependent DNA ligase domain